MLMNIYIYHGSCLTVRNLFSYGM